MPPRDLVLLPTSARLSASRSAALLFTLLLAVLTFAACGDGDGYDPAPTAAGSTTAAGTTATTAASTPEPAATTGPLQVTHELGTTEIVGVPERIVVLEYSYADNLGSLGIVPVGFAVDAPPDYLAAYTKDKGSVSVGTRAEPDLEAIAALAPDLIVADLQRHTEIYPLLSEIAPTLVFNSLRGSYQDQLDTMVVLAEVLDKEDEAAALLAAYEAEFEDAAAETKADSGEFLIGVLHAGGFTAHTNESFMGSFLEGLGRRNTLAPVDGQTQYDLTLEGIVGEDPAAIVLLCAPGEEALLDAFTSEPAWQILEAVKNERVYVFDRNLWSKGRGLLAYEQILADAVESGLLSDSPSTRSTCS